MEDNPARGRPRSPSPMQWYLVAILVGLGSYAGTVVAGRNWDAPMEVMEVPPARAGSWEQALHLMGAKDRLLLLRASSLEARKRLVTASVMWLARSMCCPFAFGTTRT